jgi:hypothetical protein
MHRSKKLVWPAFGLCICVALIGCVNMGRPVDTVRGRSAAVYPTRGSEVPLVPVPPPPLGKPDLAGAGDVRPAAGAISPVSASVPVSTPASERPAAELAPPVTRAEEPVTVRKLYEAARDRFATIDSYIVRLVRREQIKDKLNPEEVLLFKFRKEPWSVHLKWLGKEGEGREVVYVKGRYEGKMHTLLAAGDVFLMPAGKRMSFLPDSPLVRSASRHPITEAGIGSAIDRIGLTLAAVERGDSRVGKLVAVGGVKRPEFAQPVCAVEHYLPPGWDSSLPRGGRRTWYFDPDNRLPMLIQTTDEGGRMVEYYRYDRLQPSVKLDDADFDPDRLWSKPATAALGR